MTPPNVYVIIATAFNRTDLLKTRSLYSVYQQQNIDVTRIKVIVVDDNYDPDEILKIQAAVTELRHLLGLRGSNFETLIIKNSHARFYSGTGAWNTAIHMAYKEDPESFIAILDDDDEFLPYHLSNCIDSFNQNLSLQGIFQEIEWMFPDGNRMYFPLSIEEINPEAFYIGNPGIQGSNLFVRTSTMVSCGGFDETLESTTDRDLMIRLLWHWVHENKDDKCNKIATIPGPGVIHYAHSGERVSNQIKKKHAGLRRFYEKYKLFFTEADFQKSLKRAHFLFSFTDFKPQSRKIAILMAMKNNAETVKQAILSILSQKAPIRQLVILVSDDDSTDNSVAIVEELANSFPNIILHKNKPGSTALNRNWLQKYAKEQLNGCDLIGRLDADDTLSENDILQRVEKLWDETSFDALLMANKQYIGNSFTGYINRPDENLKNPAMLLSHLQQMSEGIWTAELPSCNLFLRPDIAIPFLEVASAEDHQNLVEYLIKSENLHLIIKPEWVYCNYRIDNHLDDNPIEKEKRKMARKELFESARAKLENNIRISRAKTLLVNWKSGKYGYLGAGFSGVVFHDDKWVYKVHIPLATNNFNEVDNILFLKAKLELFQNRNHFYSLRELTRVEEHYILVYPFEQSEAVLKLTREDMISFLAEMWQMKIICRSITKENNFVRVNGIIKLIDYEIEPYSDNLFLNVAARAFIQLQDFKYANTSYDKLKRSTINNFSLPELNGLYKFTEEIFKRCAGVDSVKMPVSLNQNLLKESKAIYNGKKRPAVSLLIKACVQDSGTLYNDVHNLVNQLTKYTGFLKCGLLLDVYRSNGFLRQYTPSGSKDDLLKYAEQLKHEGVIDQIFIPPHESKDIARINTDWFGKEESYTHTRAGVPVTSQIFAFEQMPGEYILQMDVDVLIGYKKRCDFLEGMIAALQNHAHALSVGFQIYHDDDLEFQPIFGSDGSIAPDVRCCLFHKGRLLDARPFQIIAMKTDGSSRGIGRWNNIRSSMDILHSGVV